MAKSTLGSLLIDLQLNTSTLNKQVSKIDQRFNKMTKTFNTVGKALAGIFAVRGITGMVKNTIALNDELGKTADRLGIVVEDLQGLHFGAEQSGVSVATLDMALQRMTRRVSEAGVGTGEAVKALKELRIEASDLSAMSVSKQFDVLADALAGVESEADQVRIAMKLFDSEGVKLLNMMKNGSQGLSDFKDEAKDLGFVLSRDMIARLEDANDSLNRVSKVGQGLKNVFTVALAPAISILSTQFVTFISNNNSATDALTNIQRVVYGVVYAFEVLAGVLKTSVGGWTTIFLYLQTAIENTLGRTEEAEATWKKFNEQINRNRNDVNALAGTIVGINPTLLALEKAYGKLPPAIEKVAKAHTELDKSVHKTKDTLKDIKFVFTNAFSSMENSIVDFAKTGKFAFADFASSIMEDLLRMIIRLKISIPLMQAMFGASGGAGGGALAGMFASGGAFTGGVQKFASGGVVSSPTVFPMAKGMGLMGEAGSEAIMPLTRTANGDLGVKALGGGSGGTIVNIYNESGSEAEVSESTNGNGQQQIDVMIRQSVNRGIGSGEFDNSFAMNYGLSRKGY